MAEKEQAHVHRMQRLGLWLLPVGQAAGFILVGGIIYLAYNLAMHDKPFAGLAGLVSACGVVLGGGYFVRGRKHPKPTKILETPTKGLPAK